jgi:hypothetical protein
VIVKLVHGTDYDEMATLDIYVDDECQLSAYPLNESPEDAYLERALSFVYDIPGLMRQAYEAGKRGDEFTIVEVDESEAD